MNKQLMLVSRKSDSRSFKIIAILALIVVLLITGKVIADFAPIETMSSEEANAKLVELTNRQNDLFECQVALHSAAEALRKTGCDEEAQVILGLQYEWKQCATELAAIAPQIDSLNTRIAELEAAAKPVESYAGVYEATAYCLDGITSTGVKPKVGVTVAVDPKVIPYGTKIHIIRSDTGEDLGYRIAQDCGGAIKGKRLDIYMTTEKECRNWGRRKVEVYIVEE